MSDVDGASGGDADTERPLGREAVMQALVDAAAAMLVEEGTGFSVRQVAARANVNHGLVHTYFGSKQGLVQAGLDEINHRASGDLNADGFPPPDLAVRRGGELARAIARLRLDDQPDRFSSHPIVESWTAALARTRPDLDTDEIAAMVAEATTMALGWAVFGDFVSGLFDGGPDLRATLDERITDRVAELGGIPTGP